MFMKTTKLFLAVLCSPILLMAWLGDVCARLLYQSMDGTRLGQFVALHCYIISGICFPIGDLGYIGFSYDIGDPAQIAGAWMTLPAHFLLGLFGDREPFILSLLERTRNMIGQDLATLRKAEKIIRKLLTFHYLIIPCAWILLACNGAGIAQSAAHSIIDHPEGWMRNVPQFLLGIMVCLGCLGLSYYVKRMQKRQGISDDARAKHIIRAEKVGRFAVSLLTGASLYTLFVGFVTPSLWLLLVSTPAFTLGNLCQIYVAKQVKS